MTVPLPPLLNPDEPLSYDALNPNSTAPLLFTAPHAGGRTPENLGTLGWGKDAFREVRHKYPYGDIGIADLSRELARLTGVYTLLSNYHRRALDINRPRNEKAFKLRGGAPPANINMSTEEQEIRFQAIFDPYHKALRQRLETTPPEALIDIHSFHSHIAGDEYDVGFFFTNKEGEKIAREFGKIFKNINGGALRIGYNVPYDLTDSEVNDGTILKTYEHVSGFGLEIRNDHIDTDEKAMEFARLLHECLKVMYPKFII